VVSLISASISPVQAPLMDVIERQVERAAELEREVGQSVDGKDGQRAAGVGAPTEGSHGEAAREADWRVAVALSSGELRDEWGQIQGECRSWRRKG